MSRTKSLYRKVLLVDDDIDEYPILQEALEEVDTDITLLFINGGYKLDVSKPLEADLVFLDINMPGCDGFDSLKKIRESEWKSIPVVMFTTSCHTEQVVKAYDLGANLFMIKPNSYTKLIQQLKSLFELDWKDPQITSKSYFMDGVFVPV